MAYIGAKPNELFRVAPTKDSFTGDGSTTTFDLANTVPAGGEFALQVFIDNVRQEPGSGKAYTLGADGSGDLKRITFTAAPDSSAAIYVLTNFDNEAFSNLDLNGSELQLDADGDTTITADTDDQIDIKVAGADDFQIVANNFKVLSGSTLTIESGATITNSGTANGFGSNVPTSADGQALGSASLEWSDLFLADGGQILLGNDQEITITHVADSGLTVKHAATGDDKFPTVTLAAGDTDIAINDKLGVINFQAPDEASASGDNKLVAAGIEAVSEGDFSNTSNATKLSFKTAASEAAAEKMSLSSAGLLTVANGLTLSDGDVTVASGHGINFAATSDGAGTDTSELLDDYEEGTWSPALANFGGSNETFVAPRYTKIGRLVTVSCQLQIGSFPSDGSNFLMTGLPYTCKNAGGTTFGAVPFRQTNSNLMGLTIGDNNTQLEMYGLDDGGGQFNYNDFGQSKQMAFVAQYETD